MPAANVSRSHRRYESPNHVRREERQSRKGFQTGRLARRIPSTQNSHPEPTPHMRDVKPACPKCREAESGEVARAEMSRCAGGDS